MCHKLCICCVVNIESNYCYLTGFEDDLLIKKVILIVMNKVVVTLYNILKEKQLNKKSMSGRTGVCMFLLLVGVFGRSLLLLNHLLC